MKQYGRKIYKKSNHGHFESNPTTKFRYKMPEKKNPLPCETMQAHELVAARYSPVHELVAVRYSPAHELIAARYSPAHELVAARYSQAHALVAARYSPAHELL